MESRPTQPPVVPLKVASLPVRRFPPDPLGADVVAAGDAVELGEAALALKTLVVVDGVMVVVIGLAPGLGAEATATFPMENSTDTAATQPATEAASTQRRERVDALIGLWRSMATLIGETIRAIGGTFSAQGASAAGPFVLNRRHPELAEAWAAPATQLSGNTSCNLCQL